MDILSFAAVLAAGVVLGLVLGWFAFGIKRYKAARAEGATFPQAMRLVIDGGGGPPRDP